MLFLNVCKHTFHVPHVRISQKVKGVCVSRPSVLGPCFQPSTLGPHLVDPRPQNIAKPNTIPLFNFEAVITLKL